MTTIDIYCCLATASRQWSSHFEMTGFFGGDENQATPTVVTYTFGESPGRRPEMTTPARFATPRGDGPSDAPFVGELLAELGFVLLPWQIQVLEVGLELDAVGVCPGHRNVTITTPRQMGKSTLMLGVWIVLRLVGSCSPDCLYAGHDSNH